MARPDLGESALRQQIGGRDVLVEQLHHLLDRADRLADTLDLLVVPFSSTGHPALGGAFHVFAFGNTGLPNLAWLESVTASQVIDDPTSVREYAIAHAGASQAALDRVSSLDLIRQTAEELS